MQKLILTLLAFLAVFTFIRVFDTAQAGETSPVGSSPMEASAIGISPTIPTEIPTGIPAKTLEIFK